MGLLNANHFVTFLLQALYWLPTRAPVLGTRTGSSGPRSPPPPLAPPLSPSPAGWDLHRLPAQTPSRSKNPTSINTGSPEHPFAPAPQLLADPPPTYPLLHSALIPAVPRSAGPRRSSQPRPATPPPTPSSGSLPSDALPAALSSVDARSSSVHSAQAPRTEKWAGWYGAEGGLPTKGVRGWGRDLRRPGSQRTEVT